MEISRIAYQHFYKGINYPNLLPHKEEYNRKNYNKNYKYNFDDYTNFCIEKKKTFRKSNKYRNNGMLKILEQGYHTHYWYIFIYKL